MGLVDPCGRERERVWSAKLLAGTLKYVRCSLDKSDLWGH